MHTYSWNELAKFLDGVSFTVVLGILVGVVPTLVGIATLVYTVIRIYETITVQKIINRIHNLGKDLPNG